MAVVAVGYLLGFLVEPPVVAAGNGQVASRVAPGIIDLLAALATGAVGSFALARPDISDTLPGVAIAISLVPPLAVVGLTAESGAYGESVGALLLFSTNVTAILASGLVVMAGYRLFRSASSSRQGYRALAIRRRRVLAVVASLVVVAVPLAETSRRATVSTLRADRVSEVVERWAADADWDVVSLNSREDGIVVRVVGPAPAPSQSLLEAELRRAQVGVDVQVELAPVDRVRVPG